MQNVQHVPKIPKNISSTLPRALQWNKIYLDLRCAILSVLKIFLGILGTLSLHTRMYFLCILITIYHLVLKCVIYLR